MYGGQVVNQILSLECTHTVERAEPFLTLSVEVKSKFSLLQSLELFVQGKTSSRAHVLPSPSIRLNPAQCSS